MIPVGIHPTAPQLATLPADVRWAVRSSATAEDGDRLSFAGMFKTELDVGAAELFSAIARVQASAYNGRVLAYAERHQSVRPHVAVVLEPYQAPAHAGVWIGSEEGGLLEWVDGPGDRLASGQENPAGSEVWAIGEGPANPIAIGGVVVGWYCLELQTAAGGPLDLEWADVGGLVWLQLRPVTRDLPQTEPNLIPLPAGTFSGVAAAAGKVTGRVIRMDEPTDEGWKPGSVLVAPAVTPEWLGIMQEAVAVVARDGGGTSHAAIIARELGIPCVTSLKQALQLATGTRVEVNGQAGTVRVLP